jgi:putative SOS response-associated peptidase YedK
MCTRYISPEDREIEDFWAIDRKTNRRKDWVNLLQVFPLSKAPFVRRARDVAEYERELVVGQWGLIPPWSVTNVPQSKPTKEEQEKGKKGKRLSTVNSRTDRMEKSFTFRNAWRRGQRCVIPASSFDEPNWESGSNVWWRFRRADGKPWGVAGLWDVWKDPETGEEWDSYTMLTMNANLHPLMSRMHKPEFDRKTGEPIFDKRSVVLLEPHDFDRWLICTVEEARDMIELAPIEFFDAGPAGDSSPADTELEEA